MDRLNIIYDYLNQIDPVIILIVPPLDVPVKMDVAAEHLGVEYLASSLREHKYSVAILDAIALPLKYEDLRDIILKYKPQVIGLSPYSFSIYNAIKLSKVSKKSGGKVLWGGHLATFAYEYILKNVRYVDIVCYGEGESAIPIIMEEILNDGELSGLPNTYILNNDGKVIKGPPLVQNDLDKLPFPSRDTIELARDLGVEFIIQVLSSRGCAGRCSFCDETKFALESHVKVWRGRSPQNVINELEKLDVEFNIVERSVCSPIVFSDPNFCGHSFDHLKRVEHIAELIRERFGRLYFTISARPEAVILMHKHNILQKLYDAGLINIYIGVENSNQHILDLYNKKVNKSAIEAASIILRKLNLQKSFGYIMFNPYTTIEDLKNDMKYLGKSLKKNPIMFGRKLRVYPGIELYNTLKKENLLDDNEIAPEFKWLDHRAKNVYDIIQKIVEYSDSVFSLTYWSEIWLDTLTRELKDTIDDLTILEDGGVQIRDKHRHSWCRKSVNLPRLFALEDIRKKFNVVENLLKSYNIFMFNLFSMILHKIENGESLDEHIYLMNIRRRNKDILNEIVRLWNEIVATISVSLPSKKGLKLILKRIQFFSSRFIGGEIHE